MHCEVLQPPVMFDEASNVESLAMKHLPDILTSATFWASIATMWAAAGAWFTYVAATVSSRQQTYEAILSLVEGLEAEFALISDWASGGEGEKGYLSKTRAELVQEHPDWLNPSRMVFTFDTPVLSNLTNSPQAKSLGPIIRPLVLLNHSIHRLFDSIARYQVFAMGDVGLYQAVLEKFAPKVGLTDIASLKDPDARFMALAHQIAWTAQERVYINHIFLLNESIHQTLIGGADSKDELCLYKAFRTARAALKEFKQGLRREPLPEWFPVLHFVAFALAWVGIWQVMRWFEIW